MFWGTCVMKKSLLFILLLGMLSVCAQSYPTARTLVLRPGEQRVSHPRKVALSGKDDRQDITGKAVGIERAAVILEVETAEGTMLCSGAMVDVDIVLTAAHCLSKDGKYHEKVTVFAVGGPSKTSQKATPNSSKAAKLLSTLPSNKGIESIELWVPDKYLELSVTDPDKADNYDYGLVILSKSLGEQTGYFKLYPKSNEELANIQEIIILGRDIKQGRYSLWEGKGRIKSISSFHFHHNVDSRVGNSGGPVLDADDPFGIIAIHTLSYGEDEQEEGSFPNAALRIRPEIVNVVNTFRR